MDTSRSRRLASYDLVIARRGERQLQPVGNESSTSKKPPVFDDTAEVDLVDNVKVNTIDPTLLDKMPAHESHALQVAVPLHRRSAPPQERVRSYAQKIDPLFVHERLEAPFEAENQSDPDILNRIVERNALIPSDYDRDWRERRNMSGYLGSSVGSFTVPPNHPHSINHTLSEFRHPIAFVECNTHNDAVNHTTDPLIEERQGNEDQPEHRAHRLILPENARKEMKRKQKAKSNQPQQWKRHKLFDSDNLVKTDLFITTNTTHALDEPTFTEVTRREQYLNQKFARFEGKRIDVTREDFNKACRAFTGRTVRGSEGGWQVKGMQVNLYDYQLLGAGKMRMLDRDAAILKGGILADQMGFGKTVTMIANIINGLRDDDCKKGADTTLIVVLNKDLARQWLHELQKFVDPKIKFDAMILGNDEDNNFSDLHRTLKRHKVIITTYNKVSMSYKSILPSEHFGSGHQTSLKRSHTPAAATILHTFHFHRVVLDECHAIKNNTSQIAKACYALHATRRWLMTGTPLQNGVGELASYFIFLRFPGISDLKSYKREFKLEDDTWSPELEEALSRIMIRRTIESTLFNQPIVKIPRMQRMETFSISLGDEESGWYLALQSRVSARIDGAQQRQELNKTEKLRDTSIFLQRLCQMRTHPLLISQVLPGLCRRGICVRASLAQLLQSCSRDHLNGPQLESMVSFIVELGERYNKYKATLEGLKSQKRDLERQAQTSREKSQPRKVTEPSNRMKLLKEELKKLKVDAPRFCHGKWLKAARGAFIGSSLLTRVENEFAALQNQAPGCKVVIFTRFVEFADIIQHFFERRGWKSVQYHGSIAPSTKEKNLQRFKEEEDILAFIATQKSGGTGLNLNMASKVMLLDLWWNTAVDDQAIGRIYRIGQKEETEILKFTVHDTIDDKVKAIQEGKSAGIDVALAGSEKGFLNALIKQFQAESQNADNPVVKIDNHELPEADDGNHESETGFGATGEEGWTETESDSSSASDYNDHDEDSDSDESGYFD